MTISKELQIGKAGEYIVCADIIMMGLIAYPSEQGLPYDVVIDNGKRLLRCQVKTTIGPRLIPQRSKESKAYIFNVKRHGKKNTNVYSNFEADIFALVCLDTRKVGYLKNEEMSSTLNLRVDALRGSYYDEKGLQDYKKVLGLADTINSQTEISKILDLNVSTVNRMLKPGYVPHETGARYFSDLAKDVDWFIEQF